ncbi:single-strand annealing weakened protein 1 [[Candida] railenensis]|uniref:Single-strand annealing weakened protein 1 n=1 Tax=[Candida] railenensis TaxID=45579 RepID=A0A9P0QTL9_9ASCO|nr:single-strand annealing weakened protein 1 [[Candida] railenensis]
MPPCLTFVKINHNSVIPVRIHVNRKRLLSSKLFHSAIDSSHKSKALLTLKKINFIRISNKDITSLTSSISHDILEYLLRVPISELVKLSSDVNTDIPVPPNSLCIDLNKSSWKCHVVVPLRFVIKLRSNLLIPLTDDDWALFNKVKSDSGVSTINLLVKHTTMSPPKILIEEDEDDAFNVEKQDTKKDSLSYKFTSPSVLTNLGRFLDIYVYERPPRTVLPS